VKAQTTYDLQAGWAPRPDLSLRLTVRNLFDSAPPFYDNTLGYAYDPTNGDPIGRFVALQLTRSW
jgi:outer membrane receptor protein involved in Fe transport